jgi:NADPH:quinone reductase-like Zn-dependent oxidoreductase
LRLPPRDFTPKFPILLKLQRCSSATGNKGVTKYPHTPGIDAVGVVMKLENSSFSINDKVIVSSYDLGMNTDGGFKEYI